MRGGTIAMPFKKMSEQKYEYDKNRLKEESNTKIVAEEIGIKINQQDVISGRKNIGIICPDPNHVDQHFGNCYIKPNGTYVCQSCNASGDVFDLVMRFCQVSFYDALEIVADICGGRERYQINKNDPIPRHRRYPLNAKECELIGLHNNKIYCASYTTFDKSKIASGDRYSILDVEKDELPTYLVEKCIEANPLMKLMKEDYDQYRMLVIQKSKEAIEWERSIIALLLETKGGELFIPAHQQTIEDIEKLLQKNFPHEPTMATRAA